MRHPQLLVIAPPNDSGLVMPSFPVLTSVGDFAAWRADPSLWLPPAMTIARRHGLAHTAPQVFPTGTNLVVALDAAFVLKIFPPMFGAQFTSERASLIQLQGRVEVPIPKIVAEGDEDGWSYLVITRLEGMLGQEAWPDLPEDQKEIVLEQIGENIAQIQRAPLGALADVRPRWREFVLAQIEGCRARHLRLGLPDKFLGSLDQILREATMLIPLDIEPVILTGEYIPENFLLARGANGWRLSGLIDFGDVMTGWGAYDLLGPSAFMTAGLPGRVASLFRGFGYGAGDMTPTLTRRLMTLMMLHRASDPLRHICIDGWAQKTDSLDDLARLLWPI